MVPFHNQRRHQNLDVLLVVQFVSNRISQGSNSVIQNQQILVLVFVEGPDQLVKNWFKIRHNLLAGIFFQSCKRAACSFLHTLVVVQYSFQQLLHQWFKVNGTVRLLNTPVGIAA
eukprot:Lithocolla_globosa_v1_NODE_763_length_3322_cov_30.849403.p2 type:complete len:115 gc:universal NODE_763_length_3322_cov_30.849403:1490-1834(+)